MSWREARVAKGALFSSLTSVAYLCPNDDDDDDDKDGSLGQRLSLAVLSFLSLETGLSS